MWQSFLVFSSPPCAQWLCPSQIVGVLLADLAADSGPIDVLLLYG